MNYQKALKFLDSLANYELIARYDYEELGLERIRKALNGLGNPERELKVIHIAGTKGKGSTAAITQKILTEAGLKVGLYTSPHLNSVRERIRIGKALIPEEDLARFISQIAGQELTYFEALTAAAFLYFADNQVDLAVLETGLGGRLDATNVIENPLATVITAISFDHTSLLGDSLEKITQEKCGIVKKSVPLIAASQPDEAMAVIRAAAASKKAPLLIFGKEITVNERSHDNAGGSFDITTDRNSYPDLRINLLGRHQLENAALAIKSAEIAVGEKITLEVARRGLERVNWPGRLEVVAREPLIVLDGAQNQASARALKEAISRHFDFKDLILVLGVSGDKDIPGILRELEGLSDRIILTRASSPRAARPEDMLNKLSRRKKALISPTPKEALNMAKKLSGKEDLILVTGSLYLIGEARDALS